MSTSPENLSARLALLDAAIQERKKKAKWFTDEQREELRQHCRAIWEAGSQSNVILHLRSIRDQGLYLAVHGNFDEFCAVYFGFDPGQGDNLLKAPAVEGPEPGRQDATAATVASTSVGRDEPMAVAEEKNDGPTTPRRRRRIEKTAKEKKAKAALLNSATPAGTSLVQPHSASCGMDLTRAEQAELRRCERIVGRGWKSFIEVGRALARIRDGKLYRGDFDTFEQYCRSRWQYSRPHAYRLIGAAEVVKILSPIGDILPPKNEAQVRPLIGLATEQVRWAWRKAAEIAKDEPITGTVVRQAVDQVRAQAVISGETTAKIENGPGDLDTHLAKFGKSLGRHIEQMLRAYPDSRHLVIGLLQDMAQRLASTQADQSDSIS